MILQNLGKIFSIKNTGNKEQIIADKENFENFKKNSQSNTAGLVDGSLFLDLFDASARNLLIGQNQVVHLIRN